MHFITQVCETQIAIGSGERRGPHRHLCHRLAAAPKSQVEVSSLQLGTQMMAQLIVTPYYFGRLLSQVFVQICHHLLLNTAL